ncbi:MAG: MBL fold metallo-hydrolase, partial [Selenomonas sp.]|nr:MBL fold metallo-hydrolase [Selenomonas sp.]
AYFYIDDTTKHGFLIDPGAQADKLKQIAEEKGFVIEKILLTHGHFDHIGAVSELQKAWNAEVCMHENGKDYAENPAWNLSIQTGQGIVLENVTYLPDNAMITLDANPEHKLQLIAVLGHTSDGCTYYSEKDGVAFVGDSVFYESYGRTDMPGGDEETLLKNIAQRIMCLPESTILLPGHDDRTSVEHERKMPWYAGRI